MAANGVARKAPPASAKNSLIDSDVIKDAMPEKKDKVVLKLKKPVPKPTIPGNWKESDASNKDIPTTGSNSPIVNGQEEKTIAGFPSGRPVEDKVDTVQCKHCRRPVLRASAAIHVRDCLSKKQEKLKKKKEAKEAKDAAARKEKGEDDDTGKNARKAIKGAVVDGEGAKKGKKRKLEGDDGKPGSKKKKKDEPKQKTAKPKGPVDVEKQCGVALPNGGFCARSLTCKSHSMGLKRAVPGRSLPYDMLLAQYQKKNQAKQQRAAIDANAPLPEDLEPSGAVDSDEEKEAIMAALARHRPRPVVTYTPISLQSKYQHRRMKDMLRSCLGNPPGTSVYPQDSNTMGAVRGLAMSNGMLPGSATSENFPNSAGGMGSFAPPLSAGLEGSGSRRQSAINMGGAGGPRMIAPGQLPGPSPQRKGSVASVGAS
ncbi:SAGA complex subunit Sgf73 [Didymosphaeria variabile]|uniref:SAGA complex subunit Sgf73 n=1 Tax=Didymosphaeria variabile TaxID=1932322 RepID=A0A9W9CCD7_9PLEO|nr:SAGA complex subunit Sgf73 [Didymosphaeria variabile]KAJ4356379.1 SAGA complex subunit Sgf73 [Didymosphaeria variabile]